MIEALSWLVVMEGNRIPLFRNTLARYTEQQLPFPVQIVLASRTITEEQFKALATEYPGYDWTYVHYAFTSNYFAPSTGFNEAFKRAKHKDIFVSFPEVWPVTNVWHQIKQLDRGTYLFKVDDLAENGAIQANLVRKGYRDATPAYYFMALYCREDIEAINGWDEDYTDGFWYDDDEFGLRIHRRLQSLGYTHQTRDDIYGQHQWHSRAHYNQEGIHRNRVRFIELQGKPNIIRCKNGLVKE